MYILLAQLVKVLAAPIHVRSCVQEVRGSIPRSRQARLWLPTLQDRLVVDQMRSN